MGGRKSHAKRMNVSETVKKTARKSP